MNDKYYTPELEEFHIGFEFETCYTGFNGDTDWQKITLSLTHTWFWDTYKEDAVETEFRVKYLDREDIESLGWIREEFPMAQRLFFTKEVDRFRVKETYSLLYVPQTSWVLIYKTQGYVIEHPDKITTTGTTVFAGEIENKSELKRILKQVKL